jgi:hypothetical protein
MIRQSKHYWPEELVPLNWTKPTDQLSVTFTEP